MKSPSRIADGVTAPFLVSRLGLPALAMIAVAALDQLSKIAVVHHRHLLADRIVVIPRFFRLVYVCNPGAAWGMFRDHGIVLTLLSAIVFTVIVWKFPALSEGLAERALALGLVLGGITGNLADRIIRGAVVDFLSFVFGAYEFPAFNVADSAISVGVAIFVVSSLLRRSGPHDVPQPPQ